VPQFWIAFVTAVCVSEKNESFSASSTLQEKHQKFSPTDKKRPTGNKNIRKNGFSITEKTAFCYYKRF
jgi:hypothetical protein